MYYISVLYLGYKFLKQLKGTTHSCKTSDAYNYEECGALLKNLGKIMKIS